MFGSDKKEFFDSVRFKWLKCANKIVWMSNGEFKGLQSYISIYNICNKDLFSFGTWILIK